MHFVNNGPDIPERLLQAHEDGRVVFFCGAGVSYPAGLPGFAELVKQLYAQFEPSPNAVQQTAIDAKQFDTAIGLLEASVAGGSQRVRPQLARILTPKADADTRSHHALLTLARNREGQTRLVTTNFDRLFEAVIEQKNLAVTRNQAPFLPVPKNRWDGLVYLHGLLPANPTVAELDRLIVSSGDFGLAYLTEGWAARFVGELFRKYSVCFIGYSLSDPVLRYMMDALAADQSLGESTPEMYAFGSYSKGKEEQTSNEWRAKHVTPILYREHRRHYYLHKTLHMWADTYRDGVRGKERVIVEYAMARPLASTQQDNFVDRMRWALSDPTGLPAKRFADLDPVPSLDWLEPLYENRYGHADLDRFGVPPLAKPDKELTFSLMRRPAPYDRAPLMAVADAGAQDSGWDPVMEHLARWLTRHLDDPALVLWLARHGGQLHERLAGLIEQRLGELAKLESDGNTEDLDRIRSSAPHAIPQPLMRTLWRLLLTGRVKSPLGDHNLYSWLDRSKRDGLTATLRLHLREMLAPRVSLSEPFHQSEALDAASEPQRLTDLVQWEIVLATDDVHSVVQDLRKNPHWNQALPGLLADFSALLRDTLDLRRELGGAEDRMFSCIDQPSISEHPQNQHFDDWTELIELTRDAWLATAATQPAHAKLAAEGWWQTPYPVFKRLALFAAAQPNVISTHLSLDWLLADDHWWLWCDETRREVMRLLVALGPKLDVMQAATLEQVILTGPPRNMFGDDAEPEHLNQDVEGDVWLRLAAMADAGTVLGSAARARFDELSARYPQWKLTADQRNEFPFWTGTGDEFRKFVATPRRRRELIDWLKQHPERDRWQSDDWQQHCRDNFATTACALYALTKESQWPVNRWREALQAWSEEKLRKRAWRYMAPVLVNAPDEILQALAHGVSGWLQTIATTFDGHESLFLDFCRRLLALSHGDGGDTDDPVMRAINHPVGQVTEALLDWWYRSAPDDGQGLPGELSPIFTELCDTRIEKFRHGRVLLAAHVIALFRVDGAWAVQYLLPLFDWHRSATEAGAAWAGFLWSPRLYPPLMKAVKPPFLDTAKHYAALGKHGKQYAALLTFAALDSGDIFTIAELRDATRSLPPEGLSKAASALAQAMEGAGEQRSEYWINRVLPYLRRIWPQSNEHKTPEISESLGRLCIAAQKAFPEALEQLKFWLQPPRWPDYLVHRLNESGLCGQCPQPALEFLSRIIDDQIRSSPDDLSACLTAIRAAEPPLATDPRFQKLVELLRGAGNELN